jgi:SET domain-containing protein
MKREQSRPVVVTGKTARRTGRRPSALLRTSKSKVHGRGVFATGLIRKGKRIIEYAGERVSWEAAPNDDTDPHTFNFGLSNGQVINPLVGGNEARWINHSCSPNCEAIEEDDRIYIYAKRDIQPGEELSYDYALEIDEPITGKTLEQYKCSCRSKNCRGTFLELKKAKGR